ncbi:MAG: hypothetical protein K0S15_1254 [Solirubrobacterales bacterium]|jgi:hypothetical protein|nr:hypothetical protein [Solirubrobacterales bacterium]
MRPIQAPREQLPPLELRRLRDLDLDEPPSEGHPAHIASASGIAKRGDFVYVVGDDLLAIGVFELARGGPGTARRVFAAGADVGEEPDKPDLEGLTSLPPVDGEPNGGLLGIGSGSKPSRDRGFYWSFAPDGSLAGEPRTVGLRPVYEAMRAELGGDINIEGAAVLGSRLWLLHRGNEGGSPNTVAEFELGDLSRTLRQDLVIEPDELAEMHAYQLGEVDGVPLCFSDATALTEDLVCFSASAESDDGEIHGSVVGTIRTDGSVRRLRTIDPRWKVEGVHATIDSGVIDFVFVCDQDDSETPSPLLSATMPIERELDEDRA